MASVKLNAGGQCVRFCFIVWNIVVLLIGIAAIGVGSWQLASNNTYEFVTGQSYASGAALVVTGGIVALLVALLGIIGAIMLWRFLLALYAIIVFLFVLLEVAAAILGFVYHDRVDRTVTGNARDAIKKDYSSTDDNSDANVFIDDIQKQFHCCGWDGYSDWVDSNFYNATNNSFPDSCDCSGEGSGSGDDCVYIPPSVQSSGQLIWREGCRNEVTALLERYQVAVGAVGIIFAILQFLAVLDACILCCCIQMGKKDYTTV